MRPVDCMVGGDSRAMEATSTAPTGAVTLGRGVFLKTPALKATDGATRLRARRTEARNMVWSNASNLEIVRNRAY